MQHIQMMDSMMQGVCCGLHGVLGFVIEILLLVVLVLAIVWLIKHVRK